MLVSNDFPNTSNPYTFTYRHAPTFDSETHPDYSVGLLLSFDPATAADLNDLLPLREAEADEDEGCGGER